MVLIHTTIGQHQERLARPNRVLRLGAQSLDRQSQRLSTVRDADQIVVLDRGRVVESGRHDELIEAPGRYATLVSRDAQLAAPEEPLAAPEEPLDELPALAPRA